MDLGEGGVFTTVDKEGSGEAVGQLRQGWSRVCIVGTFENVGGNFSTTACRLNISERVKDNVRFNFGD